MAYAYIHHTPSPPLNTYIDGLFYLNGPMPLPRMKMLPMPALQLLFNFGGPVRVYEPNRGTASVTCTESWWVGMWTQSHITSWPLDAQFLGVRFKPGSAYPFLQLPLSELHNQFVPLDAIWGSFAAEIREQLADAKSLPARFALLERLLLARLGDVPYGLNVVQYGVAEIARQHGALSIGVLSDAIGISQNHLLTQFKRLVGVPPKALARLYRLKHTLGSIDPTQPIDWALIARQSGYYDQSHFNNDFMAFLGHTPTDYLRLCRQLHAANPKHAQLLRFLPID